MNLGDLINSRGVVKMENGRKLECLEQLIEVLGRRREVTSKEKLRRAIKDREKILSTGIGGGIAVPHAKIGQVKQICAVVGVSEEGVPFEAVDDKPVQICFMIACPEDAHDEYLRILRRITLTLRDEDVRNRILQAPDTKSVIKIFSEMEY